ncbi:unnamed protein product [Prunus armeniaca]|uniref:NFD4 C-terminal domain-containing protein n=1 Tax=Prunus armeniaca TaxID=36596 RepID=A0A6J5XQY1_PRUAR|nr:hypothetical protein GBA52_019532 [Prunus armeniaca]CAB4314803.1 unnamed protein product [Prunus armeniaca]
MLIIFIATLFGLGSSFTATDNLGQIQEALGYRPQAINTFVSLHSIWNFFGRIFSRFPSEILLMKYKIPRPLMLTLALILASFGYLFIVFPSLVTLGLQLPLCVTIISKLFRLKHYVLLLNFSQLMSPLASYILNVKITGALYDKEAMKELARLGLQRIKGQPLTCIGTQCYKLSFTILTAVTLFAALGSLVLVMRTLKFYRSDIYKKFRDNAEEVVKAEEK